MSHLIFLKIANLGKHGQAAELKSQKWVILKQGNITFGNPRFYSSIPPATFAEIHLASLARSPFRFGHIQRKGVFTDSRILRSISGRSYQACGFHVNKMLHDVVGTSIKGIGISFISSAAISSTHRAMHMNSSVSCLAPVSRKMPLSWYRGIMPCCIQFSCGASSKNSLQNSDLAGRLQCFHTSTYPSVDAVAASQESVDLHFSGGEPGIPVASSTQNGLIEKPLKLLCGSSCLPHPDKEETGGEDAHFICTNKQVIGVADGVGSWADLGIDAGKYSRELMSNAETTLQEEPLNSVDPARVLVKAHAKTKAQGSSTACIIALSDQTLHAVNLGDSGFVVIRDGSTVFKSPVQQHEFNFPYQLENGNSRDHPSSAEVFEVSVSPGDVIVVGTDGLFDNLYTNEICSVVVHCVRAGFGPQIAAQELAALARERALDKNRQTPFATAAQDAGLRYHGGKLDDITVIVSYITRPANETDSPAKL